MDEIRALGFDVGHDADYEDPVNYMTVIVRKLSPFRMGLLFRIAKRYAIFPKQGDPEPKREIEKIAQEHWEIAKNVPLEDITKVTAENYDEQKERKESTID